MRHNLVEAESEGNLVFRAYPRTPRWTEFFQGSLAAVQFRRFVSKAGQRLQEMVLGVFLAHTALASIRVQRLLQSRLFTS